MFLSKKALELTSTLDNSNPEVVKLKNYISELEISLLDVISSEESEVNGSNGQSYTAADNYRAVMELPKNLSGDILIPPFTVDFMTKAWIANPDYVDGSI